ncbi:MAG: cation-translocating P-type ATPase [Nitrospira sp.]|nr:cation-translocating P-type ATPase [Nitrospira sp.]
MKLQENILIIEDMCCDSEARLIRAEIDGLKGIEDSEINLLSQSLKVRYDPSLTSLQNIITTIEKTGMKARLKKDEEIKKVTVWWKEPRMITLTACGLFILLSLIAEHIFGVSEDKAKFIYGTGILVGGYYPARMGITALRTLKPNIRTLMVAGAIGAIGLGLWEEAAVLIFIYSLGDVLEVFATGKVRSAVKALMELAPKQVLMKRNGTDVILPLEEVKVGDTIIIKPGDKIPLDGIVLSGFSSADQAPITGESIPVAKRQGDEVFAGSLNQRGALEVKVTKPFNDTTLGRIIHYVEEAETKKSSYQKFGDSFSRYYTPAMFVIAISAMVIPAIFLGNWSGWFYRSLVVLVVSCSCGIALSIPVSVVAAIANAARHGVLIKGGAYIEKASSIRAVAFDKTGSLTSGKPVITDIISFGDIKEDELMSLAASMESRSEHILANTIINFALKKGIHIKEVEVFEAIPGMGAKGLIGGTPYCVGNKGFCEETGAVIKSEVEKMIERLEEEGKTLIMLTKEGEIIGLIAVRDEIKANARKSLEDLRDIGIKNLIMLTGDNEDVAKVIAEKAGINNYLARLMPEGKVNAIKDLKEQYDNVAMVGDGVNDAPAMIASDLGIAMGAAGTGVAIETGDIVLMSDDLSKIPYVLDLSRRTVNNIKQNIIISLTIISFLVPIALTGWIGLVPGLLINEVGGLLVIINGLRLLR